MLRKNSMGGSIRLYNFCCDVIFLRSLKFSNRIEQSVPPQPAGVVKLFGLKTVRSFL